MSSFSHILLKRFHSGFSLLGFSPFLHSQINISLLVLMFFSKLICALIIHQSFPFYVRLPTFLFHFYELYDFRFYWCDFKPYFHWLMVRQKGLQLSHFEGSYHVMSISRFCYEAIDFVPSLQARIPPRPSFLLEKEFTQHNSFPIIHSCSSSP